MNEELQNALAKLVNQMSNGVDFVAGQLPQVVQDLLWWTAFYDVVLLSFWVLLVTCVWTVVKTRLWKFRETLPETSDYKPDKNDVWGAFHLIAILVTFIAFLVAWDSAIELLKVTLTPNVWVLEYVRELGK